MKQNKDACCLPAWLVLAMLVWPLGAAALDEHGITEAQLSAILEDARAEMKMPGLRAAVRYPNGRIVSASVGLADREAGTPLDDHIGMPGGSTGKTFVAALTMLLAEDGTLALDDLASRWLGDHRWFQRLPNSETMQVGHLLSHSAGLKDYPGSARFNMSMVGRVIRHGSAYFTPEELIGFARSRKPLFPAGEGYRYSDAGYLVLGRVIEAASGKSYYDLLEERILKPLALDEIRVADQSVLPDITPGYMGGGRNLRKDGRMKFDPSSEWTGGGLVTNPVMLVEFFGALAEGRVVKPESLKQMLESGWRDPEEPDWHYGYGLFVASDGKSYGHAGLWPGYRTRVAHIVAPGISIAVQTNRDGRLNLRGLIARIAEAANTKNRPGFF